MNGKGHTAPDTIRKELVQAIKNFSHYLFWQKEAGNTFLGISKKSQDLITSWGAKTVMGEVSGPFFFEGPENASVFILDSETSFFKGKSGDLLVKILGAMKLSSDFVFICNAGDSEAVHAKIKTIAPDIIITLGTKAGQTLLNIKQPLELFRGKFHDYHGIKVMPTFHPALLLKHPEYKRMVWEDMKQVMELMELKHGS